MERKEDLFLLFSSLFYAIFICVLYLCPLYGLHLPAVAGRV
jgi:hypothetical protein